MSCRRAFTLVELLVVLGIIGVLTGLLLPAIQKARETAAATSCASNLRQIGLALSTFAEEVGSYPPARLVPRPGTNDPEEFRCGGEHASWIARILPYLGESAAGQQWDYGIIMSDSPGPMNHVVRTLLCPSRRNDTQTIMPFIESAPIQMPCGCSFPGQPIPGGAVGDYGGNHGDPSPGMSGLETDLYWGGYGTGIIISSRARCDLDRPIDWIDRIRPSDVVDGLSHTLLVGELHLPLNRVLEFPHDGPMYDGSRFHFMSRIAGPGVPLGNGPFDETFGMAAFAFGSWHPGRCQFVLGDGSVRSLRNSSSTILLERLCRRNDGLNAEIE